MQDGRHIGGAQERYAVLQEQLDCADVPAEDLLYAPRHRVGLLHAHSERLSRFTDVRRAPLQLEELERRVCVFDQNLFVFLGPNV